MAIDVTCPGCFKRFQVSDRYAGMKGPCPACNAIINIPRETVTIHEPDEFQSGGKTVKGRAILKPLDRHVAVISGREWAIMAVGVIGVFALAMLVGRFNTSIGLWGVRAIATTGTLGVAFGTSIFGYILLRSGDELEYHEGPELFKRAGACAGIYTLLCVLFEILIAYIGNVQGTVLVFIYLVPFLVLGVIATVALFDLDFSMATAHYFIFFFAMICLRWAISYGWFWSAVTTAASEAISPGSSGGRMPPPPPGL